jgi:ribosome biogenesis GTPase
MQGLVLKVAGQLFTVKDIASSQLFECKVRGKLRLKELKTTAIVVVGDWVEFVPTQDREGVIEAILSRKNYMIRRSTNLSKEAHVLAANIDVALLVVCLSRPCTNFEFIDRFLASAEAYKIPAALVVNKVDEYTEQEHELLNECKKIYLPIGYPVYEVSAKTGLGMDQLRADMKGKIVLLSGNSGVGKSTLINAWAPHLAARTGKISDYHNKGKHTTTYSEIFELDEDTYLIDTPGIKGFGLVDIAPHELFHYFPDIFAYASNCKYYNCTHIHEPGCEVIKAFEEGKIHSGRYYNYVKMLLGDEGKYR